MKKKQLFSIGAFGSLVLAGALYFAAPVSSSVKAGDITGGKVAPHLNIAAFHTVHGQEGFKYPEKIAGADILNALHGKAQFIFMNHTSGLQDGDVVTVNSDVLRDNSGNFEDFGVGCQMSVKLNGKDVTLAGACQILMIDKDHREIEHKLIIKPVKMNPGEGWVLLYFDAEDGIAIYADEEVGAE